MKGSAMDSWSSSRVPAQQTSARGWLQPYLALLQRDSYDAVRYIASRSLKSLPPFRRDELPRGNPQLLINSDGTFDAAIVNAGGLTHTRIGSGGDARGTGGERSSDIDERGRVFRETSRSYDFWVDNGLALIGSPDTVVRLLKDQQRRVGYDVFLAQHQIATMPLDQVTTSLKLFGKEVMPAFSHF